ncbi:MAG: TIGR02996 domain-containing protein [Kofleriaceae bacterium]
MASVVAIISKAIFEKQAAGKSEGDVVALAEYAATPKQLDELGEGDALYLVTVRPPDEALWLVAVLESPTKGKGGWSADANTTPITDISELKSELVFANGKGLPTEHGKLGMSLQTPRVLTDQDVAVLHATVGGTGVGAKKPAKLKATTSGTSKTAASKSKTSGSGSAKSSPAKSSPAKSSPAKSSSANADRKSAKSNSSTGSGSVAAIASSSKSGDASTVLYAALTAWRGNRSPELADFIDEVGAKLPPSSETITDLATSKDPRVLGTVLAAVPTAAVSFLPTLGDMLYSFPDDPRLAAAFGIWIQDPPTTSTSAYPFWTAVIGAVTRIGDTRVIAAIDKRLRMKQGPSKFWPKFYTALKKLRDKLDALPEPAAIDSEALKAIDLEKLKAGSITASKPKLATATSLADALAHLNADRLADAIAVMVARWREIKAPALADAIDNASRQLPGWNRPLASRDAWDELFSNNPQVHLPQLLLNLHSALPEDAERRLTYLSTLDEDPRIAYRCAELSSGRKASTAQTGYWRVVNEILARHRDARTIDPLREIYERFSHAAVFRPAKSQIDSWLRDPGPLATLDTSDTQTLAAIEKLVATRENHDEARLVDAIAAEPEAAGPRAIYADWLQEQGHPYGELIALAERTDKPSRSRFSELRSKGYLRGYLDDFLEYVVQHERGALPFEADVHGDTSTLTWRHVARVPLARAFQTMTIASSLPTAYDLAAVVANAPKLTSISFTTKPAKPYQLAGWTTSKDGSLKR